MLRTVFKTRTIVGCLVLLITAGTISLLLYGWTIQREASSLLRDLTALEIGTASSHDVERIAQRHREFLTERDCHDATCDYSFVVTNRWLASLRVEPDAQFRAGIRVESGRIVRIGAGLMRSMDIYPTFGASAAMVDEYPEMPERYGPEGHYGFPTPVGKPYLRVVLDRHADAVQRQHAFAFSFKCFTKPGGGCDLSCDYLPLAWKDWRASLQPTFPDFDGVYPGSERCR